MFQELTKAEIIVNKLEDTAVSRRGTAFAVHISKGIRIYNLTQNVQSLNKTIDYKCALIPAPKSCPTAELFSPSFLNKHTTNMDYTEMILDAAFWAFKPELVDERASVVSIAWSPSGTTDNQGYLAVLSNVGNVEIFAAQGDFYKSVCNISTQIKNFYEASQVNGPCEDLDDFKSAVEMVHTTSVCWGAKSDDHSYYFVTALKCGKILIWLLQCKTNVTARLRNIIDTNEPIDTMLWIELSQSSFLLLYSAFHGEIFRIVGQLGEEVTVNEPHWIWENKDRMVAKYFAYSRIDDKIIVLCNKHRHLLAFLLDNSGGVLHKVVKNINDVKITAIKRGLNSFYVSTINCGIHKVEIKIKNNSLDLNINSTYLKEQSSSYDLYGFDSSRNEVLWVACLHDSRKTVQARKKMDKLEVIFLHNGQQDEVNLLLQNPTNKLTDYWDCIEVLRCKAMKQKNAPAVDFVQLYADGKTDMYKMKLYLILATLYLNQEKSLRIITKHTIPERSMCNVKENILFIHAKNLMIDLFNQFQDSTHQQNNFNKEACAGAKNYIKYYCERNKKQISDIVETALWDAIEDVNYTCQSCDNVVQGLSCSEGHLNIFCMLSFTPIESENYLCCKGCNGTAKIELLDRKPMCVFCDLYLTNY